MFLPILWSFRRSLSCSCDAGQSKVYRCLGWTSHSVAARATLIELRSCRRLACQTELSERGGLRF